MRIADIVRERLGVDIASFAGANVRGDLPVGDELVNRLISERFAGHPQVSALHVQAQEADTVSVLVVPRVRLLPPLRIHARIEQQPEFPGNPVLGLRWSMPSAGPLARFAAPVLGFFKVLPPGITMSGDRLAIDLAESLRARGFDDVTPLVRALAIHTRPGGFLVRFELAVTRSEPGPTEEPVPEPSDAA